MGRTKPSSSRGHERPSEQQQLRGKAADHSHEDEQLYISLSRYYFDTISKYIVYSPTTFPDLEHLVSDHGPLLDISQPPEINYLAGPIFFALLDTTGQGW